MHKSAHHCRVTQRHTEPDWQASEFGYGMLAEAQAAGAPRSGLETGDVVDLGPPEMESEAEAGARAKAGWAAGQGSFYAAVQVLY
jgi:hypothetical protein